MKLYIIKSLRELLPEQVFALLKYIAYFPSYLKYKPLLRNNINLKEKHRGQRCFILGSGPSIKRQNLLLLENEYVIALNNFCVHPDFKAIMRKKDKKYYLVAPIHKPQTTFEWANWFKKLDTMIDDEIVMVLGLNGVVENIKHILDTNRLFESKKIFWFFASKGASRKFLRESMIDISKPIIAAETVSIYAIIFALYCGFSEIYLLGMDHDYFLYDSEKDMRMYNESEHQKNEFTRAFGDDFYIEEFLRQYKIFKKYRLLDSLRKARIFNASDGGILRVFPRVKYNDLF